jgi:hypothetical protein
MERNGDEVQQRCTDSIPEGPKPVRPGLPRFLAPPANLAWVWEIPPGQYLVNWVFIWRPVREIKLYDKIG